MFCMYTTVTVSIDFWKKNLEKLAKVTSNMGGRVIFCRKRGFGKILLFFQGIPRTFFRFQVLFRPGNCQIKNQIHSRVSRTRKSLVNRQTDRRQTDRQADRQDHYKKPCPTELAGFNTQSVWRSNHEERLLVGAFDDEQCMGAVVGQLL